MTVDVIIPAYKPDKSLLNIIGMLNKQTVKPDNIKIYLTIDNIDCIDEVTKLKNSLNNNVIIEPVLKADFSHGGTRQRAVDESNSDYVLFMTQDALPADNLLVEKLLAAVSGKNVAAAYARQLPYSNANEVERFTRLFNYPKKSRTQNSEDIEKIGIKAIFMSDSCAIYNRRLHIEIGGFDKKTNFNEDSIFAYYALRAGFSVEYCADAKVYHSHNFTLKQQFSRNRDIAMCQQKHPEVYGSIKSEKEGLKYFFTGTRYFVSKKKYKAAASLFLTCAVRYLGFYFGKRKIK